MSDQREHGVGGLEWRGRRRTPDEPLVPSAGMREEPHDEATVRFEPVGWDDRGADDALDHHADPAHRDPDHHDDGHPRLSGVLPPDGDPDGLVDLSALRADDELLTALVAFDNSAPSVDQDVELKSLLLSWRLDVDAEPLTELVDTETAMATIAVGNRVRRRRPRYMVPFAAAAAVLIVVFGGMGLAARNAQPGDALWGLSQILYTQHAESVEAAASVRDDLHHASEAIQQGHFAEARSALVQAQDSLPAVDTEDGKASLQQQQQSLLTQLDNTIALSPDTTASNASPTTTTTPDPAATTTTTTQPAPSTTTTTPPPTTTTTTAPPPTTTTTPMTQSDTIGDAPAGGTGTGGGNTPAGPNQPAAGQATS